MSVNVDPTRTLRTCRTWDCDILTTQECISKDWNLYREETVEGEDGEPETLYYLKEEEEPTEEEFLAKQKKLFGKATPAHRSIAEEETVDISHLLVQKSDKPVIVDFVESWRR